MDDLYSPRLYVCQALVASRHVTVVVFLFVHHAPRLLRAVSCNIHTAFSAKIRSVMSEAHVLEALFHLLGNPRDDFQRTNRPPNFHLSWPNSSFATILGSHISTTCVPAFAFRNRIVIDSSPQGSTRVRFTSSAVGILSSPFHSITVSWDEAVRFPSSPRYFSVSVVKALNLNSYPQDPNSALNFLGTPCFHYTIP